MRAGEFTVVRRVAAAMPRRRSTATGGTATDTIDAGGPGA
jgi:hypothetical protein